MLSLLELNFKLLQLLLKGYDLSLFFLLCFFLFSLVLFALRLLQFLAASIDLMLAVLAYSIKVFDLVEKHLL